MNLQGKLWIVYLFLIVASFSIAYLGFSIGSTPRDIGSDPSGPVLPRSLSRDVVTAETVVVRKIFYAKSKLEVEERTQLPAALVGLDREQLAARLQGGIIERFSPQEIVVREVRDELAPLHAAKRFLSISDGRVALFRGVPGLAYECVEVTDIPVAKLPPQEIVDLNKGIPIYSDKNLMELLMGLSSLAFAD